MQLQSVSMEHRIVATLGHNTHFHTLLTRIVATLGHYTHFHTFPSRIVASPGRN